MALSTILAHNRNKKMELLRSYVLPLLTISTIFLFLAWIHSSKNKNKSSPPSPPKLPVIGNLHQLGTLPHRSLKSLSDKYGPLMLLHFGRVPTIVISSAELAQEVMKTHDHVFSDRPQSKIADMLTYGHDVAFSPYGEEWRQIRRICTVHLLSIKRVQLFDVVRKEEVKSMVENIQMSKKGVNLTEILRTLTCDVVCRAALGRKYSTENCNSSPHRMLDEFVELLGTFPVGDFIPWLGWIDRVSGLEARVKKTSIQLDEFIEGVLDDRMQAKQRLDDHEGSRCFVDILLSLDEDKNEGLPLSRDCIKAIILDMFAAGTDTVSTVMVWTMAELVKHQKEMKKVQDEIRHIIGAKGTIEAQNITQMKYMLAVIKEVMRLHCPIALLVPRKSMQNVRLQGYEIPSGMRTIVNAWAIGRDPRSWDNPEEFRPERFINSSVDFKGQDFQLIPFGAGRRGCPGVAFAMATIELAIANLLYHFDWDMPNGRNREELDMSEMNGIAVRKKSNLVLAATSKYL